MEAKSRDRKTIALTENGEELGELIYENLFQLKAEIRHANGDTYGVRPVGLFSTSIAVAKSGTEIATLKMNWRGQIVFAFGDREYLFKATGTFYNKYVIESSNGEKVIQLDPKFNWKNFDYNYDISYGEKRPDILLILISVYASNYFIASMSGAV